MFLLFWAFSSYVEWGKHPRRHKPQPMVFKICCSALVPRTPELRKADDAIGFGQLLSFFVLLIASQTPQRST
jgi:hypothetical protein